MKCPPRCFGHLQRKNIFDFGVLKSLRAFQNPFFMGGQPLSGAPAPDSPLLSPTVTSSPGAGEVFPLRGSQAVKFIAKVLGSMSEFPAALLPLPLGEVDLRSKDGEGARRQALTGGVSSSKPQNCILYKYSFQGNFEKGYKKRDLRRQNA